MISSLIVLSLLATTGLTAPRSKASILQTCLSSKSIPVEAPNSTDYTVDAKPFNVRIPYTPVAVVVAQTVEHVQGAVACGVEAGVKVTPKCGGHSWANYGFGGEDGHLMIEMDRMHEVVLDEASGKVTVQGGSRLGHVASEIYTQGKRAISHGTCPPVGVSGHALHGGYGMSSHTHGLAVDWIDSLTVVLANASIVAVTPESHPDVLWALKGAGSSFGIVTDYTFNTFEAPTTVTPFLAVLPWTQDKAVSGFKAIQDFVTAGMPKELNMRLVVASNFVNLEGLYYGDRAALEEVISPLLDEAGGMLAQATTTDWLGQLKHFGLGLPLDQTHPSTNKQENFYSSSLYTDALTDDQITSMMDYAFNTARNNSRSWYMQIDFHGDPNSAVIAQQSAETSSYAWRDKLYLYSFYDRVDIEEEYPADGFSLIGDFIKSIVVSMDDGDYGMYFNYPDPELDQESAQGMYWGGNLVKLKGVKAALDPDEVFYFPQSVRPPKE